MLDPSAIDMSLPPKSILSVKGATRANFSTCCGLEWLLNNPSKFIFQNSTITCYHPKLREVVFVDRLRGRPICPCILENANITESIFVSNSAEQCRAAFQWTLVNGTCAYAPTCPPGTRLTPISVGNLYNCSFDDKNKTCLYGHSYILGSDMSCEGECCKFIPLRNWCCQRLRLR